MINENRIVYVDMDDVMTNCVPTLIEAYNRMYDSDITIEDITEWSLPKDMARIFKYPGFFFNLSPVKGAIEGIRRIGTTHNFEGDFYYPIIATSCGNIPDVRAQKKAWVNKYLSSYYAENMIFTEQKSSLKGFVIIDDAPHHLHGFSGFTICMDRPWNQEVMCDWRIYNQDWNEIIKLFGAEIHEPM